MKINEFKNLLEYNVKNARVISVRINKDICSIIQEYKVINKIILPDNESIYLEQDIYSDNPNIFSPYTIKKIKFIKEGGNFYDFDLYSAIINKSSIYLVPSLYNSDYQYDTLGMNSYFFNSYVSKDKLVICYRKSLSKSYEMMINKIINHPDFIEIISNEYFDYLLFNINVYDLETFLEGKYSKLSNELKYKIKKFYSVNDNHKLAKILSKSEDLRKELELMFGVKIPKDMDLDDKPKNEELILN